MAPGAAVYVDVQKSGRHGSDNDSNALGNISIVNDTKSRGCTCMNAVAIMTPLPKNFATMNAASGIFNAGTRFERTGKNAPTSQYYPEIRDFSPTVLVTRMTNKAPICNPMLNLAVGSIPPPPHRGLLVAVGASVLVALSRTCRATRRTGDGMRDIRYVRHGCLTPQDGAMLELAGGRAGTSWSFIDSVTSFLGPSTECNRILRVVRPV